MKTLVKLLIIAAAVTATIVFLKKPAKTYTYPEVWVGDEVSGCMYPVAEVSDGKDPAIWNEQRPRWNQFESQKAAKDAGYRICP